MWRFLRAVASLRLTLGHLARGAVARTLLYRKFPWKSKPVIPLFKPGQRSLPPAAVGTGEFSGLTDGSLLPAGVALWCAASAVLLQVVAQKEKCVVSCNWIVPCRGDVPWRLGERKAACGARLGLEHRGVGGGSRSCSRVLAASRCSGECVRPSLGSVGANVCRKPGGNGLRRGFRLRRTCVRRGPEARRGAWCCWRRWR